VLALGAHAENSLGTVCVTRGRHAVVSAPIGDAYHPAAHVQLDEAVERLLRLLGVVPAAIAHDAHDPRSDTRSERYGRRHDEHGDKDHPAIPRIAVQHHHAHVAACMAEHGCTRRVFGVVLDGEGAGPEGARWGGEFLLADLADYRRVGHLRPLAVLGGEAANGLEPWRAGLAALVDAGEELDVLAYIPHAAADVREHAAHSCDRGSIRSDLPRTSCASRWLDAFAAIAGVRSVATYESQAALELDAFATAFRASEPSVRAYAYAVEEGTNGQMNGETAPLPEDDPPFVVDLRPAIRAVAADIRNRVPRGAIALGVHRTMAAIVVDAAERVRARHGIGTVALTGACFTSRRLTETTKWDLEERGFEVLVHRRVPPTDAGLSLGQAAIAAQRLSKPSTSRPPRSI
jgi:hydrogenase maturation protein HypF